MSLALSFFIAVCGAVLLVVSSRLGGAESGAMAAALLSEDERPRRQGALSPFCSRKSEGHTSRRMAWVAGAAIALLISAILLKATPISIGIALLMGAAAGELYSSRTKDAHEKLRLRKMEFYLPTVMERIVMAVGAGLDIVPALREASCKARDPVSELMQWIVNLAESGTPVEAAFEMASQQPVTASVKHACIHLGLAYRQGGEIVRPLKELSDATQVAYQEAVEEQIAKLPVKAVLPLVLTFTGLIVCFLTVPLMQIGSITKEVASVASR